jgi:hypothetical protein
VVDLAGVAEEEVITLQLTTLEDQVINQVYQTLDQT